jgi:hypothetical protein
MDILESVEGIARRRRQSQVEQVLSNGVRDPQFARGLVPQLFDRGCIDSDRFQALSALNDDDLLPQILQTELVQLVVASGIAESAAAFYQTNRSKDDALRALYRAHYEKAERERMETKRRSSLALEAALKAERPSKLPEHAQPEVSSEEVAQRRRNSLVR